MMHLILVSIGRQNLGRCERNIHVEYVHVERIRRAPGVYVIPLGCVTWATVGRWALHKPSQAIYSYSTYRHRYWFRFSPVLTLFC